MDDKHACSCSNRQRFSAAVERSKPVSDAVGAAIRSSPPAFSFVLVNVGGIGAGIRSEGRPGMKVSEYTYILDEYTLRNAKVIVAYIVPS